jgi:hypothetical protein
MKQYVAEAIGTSALVFFGCATVIFMRGKVGLLGVAFAFGLAVTAMAHSIYQISRAHLNPAVSLGTLTAGRMTPKDFAGYVIAQFVCAILAAAVTLQGSRSRVHPSIRRSPCAPRSSPTALRWRRCGSILLPRSPVRSSRGLALRAGATRQVAMS